jgi:hypothetical protein
MRNQWLYAQHCQQISVRNLWGIMVKKTLSWMDRSTDSRQVHKRLDLMLVPATTEITTLHIPPHTPCTLMYIKKQAAITSRSNHPTHATQASTATQCSYATL